MSLRVWCHRERERERERERRDSGCVCNECVRERETTDWISFGTGKFELLNVVLQQSFSSHICRLFLSHSSLSFRCLYLVQNFHERFQQIRQKKKKTYERFSAFNPSLQLTATTKVN